MQQANFFANIGGLNLADSPFAVQDGQATLGGYNYEYTRTGAITKIRSLYKINSAADAQVKTLGLGVQIPATGVQAVIRAAGQKLQKVDVTAGTFTTLTDDTNAAGTNFLASGTTVPVVMDSFNTQNNNTPANMLWVAGGGMALPVGFNGTVVTTLGVQAPTGTFTVANQGSATGGEWGAKTGVYWYSLALRKKSTQALSNASLDKTVTVATATDSILLTFPTGIDTTLYDMWYVFRSAVGGVTGFTTGDLVSQVATTQATFTDTFATYASTQNIPRAGNVVLDNSPIPTTTSGVYTWTALASFVTGNSIAFSVNGTPYTQAFTTDNATTLQAIATQMAGNTNVASAVVSGDHGIILVGKNATALALTGNTVTGGASQATITTAQIVTPQTLANCTTVAVFKRRLCVAQGNTVYVSDLDKPESFPTALNFPINGDGPITALSTIGYNPPNAAANDEFLMVFTANQLWTITGSGIYDSTTGLYDFSLLFVDDTGCSGANLPVRVNGFVAWMDYRGIYMWAGYNKPAYVSRPIETLWGYDGDLDKSQLSMGYGVFYRQKNQVIWVLSHRIYGTNKFRIKLDLRLTSVPVYMPSSNLEQNKPVNGVFMCDQNSTDTYAGVTYVPTSNTEYMLVGDAAGFVYQDYWDVSEAGNPIKFTYNTRNIDFGTPAIAKTYNRVIVWIEESVSNNLTLNYWSNYNNLSQAQSTVAQPMSDTNDINASLFDLALWDIALWDEFNLKLIPIVFNLNSAQNNNIGDSLMLQFSQQDANAPVTIHGFSVFYDLSGVHH